MPAGFGALTLLWRPQLMEYMLPTRFWLDSNHFLVAIAALLVGLAALLTESKSWVSGRPSDRSWLSSLAGGDLLISLVLAFVAGMLIFLKIPGLDPVTRYCYSVFDLAVALAVLGTLVTVLRHACQMMMVSGSDGD